MAQPRHNHCSQADQVFINVVTAQPENASDKQGADLHESLVEVLELCNLVVNLVTQTTGKVAEDERLSIRLLVVVINVRNIEVLLGNDDCVLVVVGQILHGGQQQSASHQARSAGT